MAESLVLANLVIDPSGVVRGIAVAEGAMAKGEKNLKKYDKGARGAAGGTDLLVGKMTTMRPAISRLAGKIGIAGLAIAALGFALNKLIIPFITQTRWFKKMKIAIVDWSQAVIFGEGATGRLARNMANLHNENKTGVTTTAELIDKLQRLTKTREDLEIIMSGAPSALEQLVIPQDIGLIDREINATMRKLTDLGNTVKEIKENAGLFGKFPREETFTPKEIQGATDQKTPADRAKEMSLLTAAMKLLNQQQRVNGANQDLLADGTENLRSKMEALKATAEEFAASGIPEHDMWAKLGILDPRAFKSEMDEVTAKMAFLQQNMGDVGDANQYDLAIQNVRTQLMGMGKDAFEADEIIRKLGGTIKEVSEMGFDLDAAFLNFKKSASVAQAKFQSFQVAVAGVSNAVAESLFKGGKGMKKAIAEMLLDMAKLMITYAVMNVALGMLASTGYGQLFLGGTAKQFFTAAAKFAVVAAIAGAGSAALGGGGGGGEGEGGRDSSVLRGPTVTPGGAAFPNVTINVQGSILGTDPNELARDLAELLKTAGDDGRT